MGKCEATSAFLLGLIISFTLNVQAYPAPDASEDLESVKPEGRQVSESVPESTTTRHFLHYILDQGENQNPWLANLIQAAAPVLAAEGIGGIIQQSFKIAPVLALGASNVLANHRIGPLLNIPTFPTTTVVPPFRYRTPDEVEIEIQITN